MSAELQTLKADLFRALAHPTRIRLLERLTTGEQAVQALAGGLGLDQPVASQHLAALRTRGLVTARKEGTAVYYTLRSPLIGDLLRDRARISERTPDPAPVDAAGTAARGAPHLMRLFAKIRRTGVVTEPLPEGPGDAVTLADHIDERARKLFGRALAIRQVDAGSCNGCEVEIAGLPGPIYDMERFGLHFVASPRHADMLLVTGPVTRNMAVPFERRTRPRPIPNSSWRLATARGPAAFSPAATPWPAPSTSSSPWTRTSPGVRPNRPTSCAAFLRRSAVCRLPPPGSTP